MLELFRRHQARAALASFVSGDVSGAAAAAAERNDELVAGRLERLADEGALGCASGCSHCCSLDVNVSMAEVARLAAFVEERFTKEERAALRSRLEGPRDEGPCALLVDGRCSVYAARPLACRGWNSADAEACRVAATTESGPASVPVYSQVRDTASALAESLRDAARAQGWDASALDLRSSLRGLLDSGEAVLRAWQEGEALPAEWHPEDDEPPERRSA